MTTPRVAIVDGYATGTFLPAAFKRLGADVVHVLSTREPRPMMAPPDLSAYATHLICADAEDFERTASALTQLGTMAVVAGQEPGVELADRLSEHLRLPSNGTAQSAARRDKYVMIEALRAAGLRCAQQFKSADANAVRKWAEGRGSYPVVVKPLRSSSKDHVTICPDATAVTAAARSVLAAPDMFGTPNSEALVQSFLPGVEYAVDTVSMAGSVYVCGVWLYEKTMLESGYRISDRDILVDSGAWPVPELIEYTKSVLQVLGIRYGPAHTEIMMTPAGPALVEIGARLNGALHPVLHDICLPVNQVDVTALAYMQPRQFMSGYADRIYRTRQQGVVLHARTEHDGVIVAVDYAAVAAINSLPTVLLTTLRLTPGKRITPTVDLLTSPLRVFMASQSAAALRSDYCTIQGLSEQVYRVRRDPVTAADGH